MLIADKQQFEGAFTYQFHVMTFPMTIMQHGEHFELRINNVSFTHIHAQEQTKNQFVYEDHKASADSQTKTTASQPTTFDFNNPMPAQPSGGSMGGSAITSMSGGAPRVPASG